MNEILAKAIQSGFNNQPQQLSDEERQRQLAEQAKQKLIQQAVLEKIKYGMHKSFGG